MKELYKEFFQVSEQEKVSDKVFYTRLVLSIVTIAVCMVLLCSTSYAWFTSSVASNANNITAAKFLVDIKVKDAESANLSPDEEGYYTLMQGKAYCVTINRGASATASTGYCTVNVNKSGESESSVYYTTQITEESNEITFKIDAQAECKVSFTPQWGTSVNYVQNQQTYGAGTDDTITVPSDISQISASSLAPVTKAVFEKSALGYNKTIGELPATRVVFGNYEEYKAEIEAGGLAWEDGSPVGSKVEAGGFSSQVRRFDKVSEYETVDGNGNTTSDGSVTITRYILAEGDNILYFPEDSSDLFKELSSYVASVEFGSISMEDVKNLTGMFENCQRLVRIYAREKTQEAAAENQDIVENSQTVEEQESMESQEQVTWDESQIVVEHENQNGMFLECTNLRGGAGTTVQWVEEVLKRWQHDFIIAEDNQTLYDRTDMLGKMLNMSGEESNLHTMLDEMKSALQYSVRDNGEMLRIDKGPCAVGEDGKSRAGLLTSIAQKEADQEQLLQYRLYQFGRKNEEETLESVAQKFGLTVEVFLQENGLETDASIAKDDWLVINCMKNDAESIQ